MAILEAEEEKINMLKKNVEEKRFFLFLFSLLPILSSTLLNQSPSPRCNIMKTKEKREGESPLTLIEKHRLFGATVAEVMEREEEKGNKYPKVVGEMMEWIGETGVKVRKGGREGRVFALFN